MDVRFTRGVVETAADKAKAGGATVLIQEVGDASYPEPFDPVTMTGWHWPPEPGDVVQAVIPGDGEMTEHADAVCVLGVVGDRLHPTGKEFHTNYPKRRGFKTKAGHTLIIDDKDKTITLHTPSGHTLLLDEKEHKVRLTYNDTVMVSITPEGIFLGSEAADQKVVLGNILTAILDTVMGTYAGHSHSTGVGPSGPPSDFTTWNTEKAKLPNALSDFVFTQKVMP